VQAATSASAKSAQPTRFPNRCVRSMSRVSLEGVKSAYRAELLASSAAAAGALAAGAPIHGDD
jgi:hypothetical protein